MFDKTYLTPAEALTMILDKLPRQAPHSETLRIEECYGRIAASDVVSAENLPGFARSSMDGYAVK
jgi:molybdopterin molybdotransferase